MEPYSVLMSVYQKETPDYFYIAIQSMLNQTIPPDDIVMMCDGPLTPELDQVIAYFDRKHPGLFQIVRIPQNGGLGKALREGVLRCKHEIIARMDTDDIVLFQESVDIALASEVGGGIAPFSYDISAYVGFL